MKQHCWCHMLGNGRGTMIDPEHAAQVRDGMPMCSDQCAARYDEQQQQRRDYLQLRLHNAVTTAQRGE